MKEEVLRIDTTFNLTDVESKRKLHLVPGRYKDILSGLAQQAGIETDAMHTIQDELVELRPKYQRYRELTEELKVREERARIAAGLFVAAKDSNGDIFAAVIDKLDSAGLSDIAVSEEVPLWKILREVLRQVPEMQVIDLEFALKDLGVKTTRQAIDSAIAAHSKVFSTRKQGREKFISLKGV
jgi:hypothetical protein